MLVIDDISILFLRMNPFEVGALCSLRNLALKMFQNILLAFHPLYYYVVFGIMHVWWYTTWRQRKTIHLRTGACKTCRPTGDVFNKELVVWLADGRMMQTVVGFSLSVVKRKAKWQPSFSKYSHGDIDRWCRVRIEHTCLEMVLVEVLMQSIPLWLSSFIKGKPMCGHHEHYIYRDHAFCCEQDSKKRAHNIIAMDFAGALSPVIAQAGYLYPNTSMAVKPLLHLLSDSTLRPFDISFSPDPTACHHCPLGQTSTLPGPRLPPRPTNLTLKTF